jgi:hypothetical protein
MAAVGEKFDPKMLRHDEGRHNFGTEDPVIRGTKGFQPSHGNWTAWSDGKIAKATDYLGRIASQLGYSLDTGRAISGGR